MPGGGLEPEEEPRNAAIREVEEEAGVLGKLGRCLGVFEVRVHKCFQGFLFVFKFHSLIPPLLTYFATIKLAKLRPAVLFIIVKKKTHATRLY